MSKPFEWGWAIWYYDYDGLGTVSEIVDWQGNALERYTYDEYGSFTITDGQGNQLTSSPSGNRFFFTGREWDAFLSLYYYRARWYDAKLGRFLQKDPVGYLGGINLYRYSHNNPLNYVDPFGLYEAGIKGVLNPVVEKIISDKIGEKRPDLPKSTRDRAAEALRKEMTADEYKKLKAERITDEEKKKILEDIVDRAKDKPEYEDLKKELEPYFEEEDIDEETPEKPKK